MRTTELPAESRTGGVYGAGIYTVFFTIEEGAGKRLSLGRNLLNGIVIPGTGSLGVKVFPREGTVAVIPSLLQLPFDTQIGSETLAALPAP
jgi:hypothetical protein